MVQREAQDFNSRVFGNIFKHKRSLEACLRGIQCTLEHTDIPNLAMLERDIHKEYNEVLKQEEILWYQKSRENGLNWVIGIRNSSTLKPLCTDNETRFKECILRMALGVPTRIP